MGGDDRLLIGSIVTTLADFGVMKTAEDLIREDIERQTLETVARRLEQEHGNETYMTAWRKAVKIIRSMKP